MTKGKSSLAFLGPAGTYSNEAAHIFAQRLHIDDEGFKECASFDEVFAEVDEGRCEFGVVPTENSLEGSVGATLDNFAFHSTASILGEQIVPINHCLLTSPKTTLSQITTIASHPQGLAQCRRSITALLPGRSLLSTTSTAESARLAAGDPSIAGIGSAFAGSLYGLTIAAQGIEDHPDNQTLFTLIGSSGHPPVFEGEYLKTSLAFFLHANKKGSLLMILSELAYANVNLTKIQSRPTKQALGDYMFFIDLEGTPESPLLKTALECLRLKLRDVKILGTYPISLP